MSAQPDDALLEEHRADYAGLSDDELERCMEGAARLLRIQQALVHDEANLLGELFGPEPEILRWAHYPEGDARDPQSGAMYYYHAHDEGDREAGEHGHFHSFIPDESGEGFNHLVAVSVDARGQLRSLFTTNRWVTDEVMRPAPAIIERLDSFQIDLVRPSWLVSQWLEAVLLLFRPTVAALLRERDRLLGLDRFPDMAPDSEVLEDRARHVVCERTVSWSAAIRALEAELLAREAS